MSQNLSNNYYNYSISTRHKILQKLNKSVILMILNTFKKFNGYLELKNFIW